jgi:transposase
MTGAWANIPPKSNRRDPICFQQYLYRARNRVERSFNKIKQRRRVTTRYDRLAANCLAFVQLASIRLWLCWTIHSISSSARPVLIFVSRRRRRSQAPAT